MNTFNDFDPKQIFISYISGDSFRRVSKEIFPYELLGHPVHHALLRQGQTIAGPPPFAQSCGSAYIIRPLVK